MHAFRNVNRQVLLRGIRKLADATEHAGAKAAVAHPGWMSNVNRTVLPLFSVQVRNAWIMHVNKDWRPNVSFPQTPEEHVQRAHWYGMHPADYKINLDNQGERPMGDYPDIPIVAEDEKDAYEPWDYPYHRSNFNEPILREWEDYSEMRMENFIYQKSPLYMICVLWGSVSAFFLLIYVSRNFPHWFPLMSKTFPHNDQWSERGLDPRLEKQITAYTWDFED